MDQQDKSAPKWTPGPWFADSDGNVWRRPPSDLYQNGGGVAGDKPIATAHKGWHGESEVGYPVEANARLIAAAPELYEALKRVLRSIPTDADMRASGWEQPEVDEAHSAYAGARAALAKATGSQQ